MKNRLRLFGMQFGAILTAIALSFLSLALMFVALLILASADVLGGAMWAILLVYLGGLAALVAFIHHRRDLRELRVLLGDEDFFQLYPAEKRREERKKLKKRNNSNGKER